MPLRSNGMRDYVDPVMGTVSLLESGESLPDDDPETRNGGLDPARRQDSGQIDVYMKLRQSGQISDQAWARLIQRNPRAATLFSVVGPSPESLAEKNRRDILSRYFAPEQAEVPFQTTEEQEFGMPALQGNIAQEASPAKADLANAINALVQAGDIAGAKNLRDLYVGQKSEGYTLSPGQVRFDATGRRISAVPKDTTERDDKSFANVKKLRDEFINQSKPFKEVRDSYERVYESGLNPSAAGDLALVFNYMKMLDPGSTVREGEFATAQNSAGVDNRIRAMYNRVMSGERLAPTTRADFLSRAEGMYNAQLRGQEQLESTYRGLAARNKFSPDDVIIDYRVSNRRKPAGGAPANSPGGSVRPRVKFSDLK